VLSRPDQAVDELAAEAGVPADTMLRVSPYPSFWLRGQENERSIMGNVAVAEELVGAEHLDELYQLDASEPKPEGMPADDEPPAKPKPEGMPADDEPPAKPKPEGMPADLSDNLAGPHPTGAKVAVAPSG
jgi:hypothetical protein